MQPQIIRFEPGHLLAFDWREFEREDCAGWTRELMRRYPSVSYTGIAGGRVLGCAGLIFFEGGVAFAWLAASCDLERHKLWFHRTIKMYFRAVVRSYALRYVFTWVREDSERNRKWIEAMGFERQAESQAEPDGTVHLKYAIGAM
jgi:hypothetical protein